jgi:hypothetical protein
MLSHEWRELELLCDRISNLRHRFAAAQKTKNVGLLEGLRDDISRARRQRELLVQHISARLGAATATRSHQSRSSTTLDAAAGPGRAANSVADDPDDALKAAMIYGFHDG